MTVYVGPEIQTVVWDLDGTLLQSFDIFCRVLHKVLPAYGLPRPPLQRLAESFHGPLERSIRDVVGQHVTERIFRSIVDDFIQLDNASMDHVDRHLYADALSLAQRFHQAGKRQLMVTDRHHGENRGNASPRTMIPNSRLGGMILDVVCGDDSEYRKPHPQALPQRLWRNGERAIMIGDQWVDAQFARNLGIDAILVARSGRIPHLNQLGGNWHNSVHIVPSLDAVRLALPWAA